MSLAKRPFQGRECCCSPSNCSSLVRRLITHRALHFQGIVLEFRMPFERLQDLSMTLVLTEGIDTPKYARLECSELLKRTSLRCEGHIGLGLRLGISTCVTFQAANPSGVPWPREHINLVEFSGSTCGRTSIFEAVGCRFESKLVQVVCRREARAGNFKRCVMHAYGRQERGERSSDQGIDQICLPESYWLSGLS
jgi:hypothetical protein